MTKDQHETTRLRTSLNLQNLHPRFKSGRRLQSQTELTLSLAGGAFSRPAGDFCSTTGSVGAWRKWRLEITRLATRETTAVLYLDEGPRLVEQARLNWDSTAHEPSKLRAGIGFSSVGAAATIWADEIRLTESELSL